MNRSQTCRNWILLAALAPILCNAAGSAEPIRADADWAIYPQAKAEDWTALVQAGNLLAGLPVAAQPTANDHNTGGDPGVLTDGVLAGANGRMWSDKRAVGWAYQPYARLTFDLGQPRPVGQVAMRLQVINKDNTLPRTITISLSNDGEAYSPIRNLSSRSHPEDNPALTYEPLPADPPGIYAVVINLNTQARFVRLDFALHGTLVSDEIAIIPAPGAVQQLPPAAAGPARVPRQRLRPPRPVPQDDRAGQSDRRPAPALRSRADPVPQRGRAGPDAAHRR